MEYPVSAPFASFIAPAVVRLSFLFPDAVFEHDGAVITINGINAEEEGKLRKEICFALYREKIYADTLDLRTGLIGLLSQK